MKPEAEEQATLMEWASFMKYKYPGLKMLFHIPNGGSRNPIEAAHLKKQGVKPGVPDLFLPIPNGKYHGLFIEMKAKQGRIMENQKMWIRWLNANGYKAVICWGCDHAIKTIEEYLNG